MRLSDHLSRGGVAFLAGTTREDALRELAQHHARTCGGDPATLYAALQERERVLSSWIAPGVAIPHVVCDDADPQPRIVVGVSRDGVDWAGADGQPVHVVVLLAGGGHEHLAVLRQVARRLSVPGLVGLLATAPDTAAAWELLVEGPRPAVREGAERRARLSRRCFEHAVALARDVDASAIYVHVDGLGDLGFLREADARRLRLVTTARADELAREHPRLPRIDVPFRGSDRGSPVEPVIVFGLARGLLHKGDRVVSVYGAGSGDALDALRVSDIGPECELFLSPWLSETDGELGHQVLARAIEIAGEIAREGREGRPVGTILVVGDSEAVRQHCQQLIMNPFLGHPERDRNLLDPGLGETIKELARIDGAFVVRGDGVLVSAGTYLRTRLPLAGIPPGLGARHAAAMAITSVTRATALAVSESTRIVSLFRGGQRLMEL